MKKNNFFLIIQKLKETKFLVIYIDELSCNPSALPLYSWIKRWEPADKMIRETTSRLNSIAAQWNKYAYFLLKTDTSKMIIYEGLLSF